MTSHPGRPLIGSAPAHTLSVRLDPELNDRLIDRAYRDRVTRSEVIRVALTRYLAGGSDAQDS